MRPFHSVLRTEPVSNPRRIFFFFGMVHEIWMLFISPANPDFFGQKRRKTTEINLADFLVEHTNTQANDTGVNTKKSTLSAYKQANKHIITIHKQKYRHTHTEVGKDHAYLGRSVFT